MTIVVAVTVADGLVLASDSATTQQWPTSSGHIETINIWNSANKIFNLHKGLPVGALTWDRASFDGRSISSHVKDLRRKLMGLDPSDTSLQIYTANYTVQEIAEAVRDHFEALNSQYSAPADLGMLIGGYGSGDLKPEVWQLDVLGAAQTATLTQPLPPGEPGILQWGQPEAISRIVDGVSLFLPQALTNLGVQDADADAYVDAIKNEIGPPIVHAGMPLGEVGEPAMDDTKNVHVRVYRTRASGAAARATSGTVQSAKITQRTPGPTAKLPPLKLRVAKAKRAS